MQAAAVVLETHLKVMVALVVEALEAKIAVLLVLILVAAEEEPMKALKRLLVVNSKPKAAWVAQE
jgi:hypothetical protein